MAGMLIRGGNVCHGLCPASFPRSCFWLHAQAPALDLSTQKGRWGADAAWEEVQGKHPGGGELPGQRAGAGALQTWAQAGQEQPGLISSQSADCNQPGSPGVSHRAGETCKKHK